MAKKEQRLGIILSTAVYQESPVSMCTCEKQTGKGRERMCEFRLMHCYFVSQTAVNVIKRRYQSVWQNKHYLFLIGAHTMMKSPFECPSSYISWRQSRVGVGIVFENNLFLGFW